jgi:hypothetical protein
MSLVTTNIWTAVPIQPFMHCVREAIFLQVIGQERETEH